MLSFRSETDLSLGSDMRRLSRCSSVFFRAARSSEVRGIRLKISFLCAIISNSYKVFDTAHTALGTKVRPVTYGERCRTILPCERENLPSIRQCPKPLKKCELATTW